MKGIEVAAAVIIRGDKGNRELLATQRGHGNYKGYWEFPGGQIEAGETAREALTREIREELDIEILIDRFFYHVEFGYPEFHLSMDCYLCHIDEEPRLLEHEAAMWLPFDDLFKIKWLPADIEVLEKLGDIK